MTVISSRHSVDRGSYGIGRSSISEHDPLRGHLLPCDQVVKQIVVLVIESLLPRRERSDITAQRSDALFEGLKLSNKLLLFRLVHLLEVGRNNSGSRDECANTSNDQEKRKQEESSVTQISTKPNLVHCEAHGEQLGVRLPLRP